MLHCCSPCGSKAHAAECKTLKSKSGIENNIVAPLHFVACALLSHGEQQYNTEIRNRKLEQQLRGSALETKVSNVYNYQNFEANLFLSRTNLSIKNIVNDY